MWWKRKRRDGPVRARARMGPLDGERLLVAPSPGMVALPRPDGPAGRATVDYRLSRTSSGDYVLDYVEDQRPVDPA